MNPNYPKDQPFGSENLQTIITNLVSQTNPEQVTAGNVSYATVQHVSNYSSNQRYGHPEVYDQNPLPFINNVPIVQDNFVVNQPTTFAFFFRPKNDICNYYHIEYNEISIQLF
ncbi:hypothetical protein C1645_817861 [Glomus cerebriforme]|uniref:Uncharacterized protein n=1 Tax=Glomus cerebriforme TaxID=658196 RepID=A0A397T8L7_9GLOM|nr:hypothetical protein C1645_817861 [Glomus cerebriforme]